MASFEEIPMAKKLEKKQDIENFLLKSFNIQKIFMSFTKRNKFRQKEKV